MQVLEVMERVNSTQTNLVIKYIRNAFLELQETYYEKTKTSYISLVSGISDYNLPADYVALVPGGSDNGIQINDNITDSGNYRWSIVGRKLRVYRINDEDQLDEPNESYTNGIAITHTFIGYDFIYNPSGNSDYYSTGAITSGIEVLIPSTTDLLDTIVSVTDQTPSIRTDYAELGHHYKRTAYNKTTDSDDLTVKDLYMISGTAVAGNFDANDANSGSSLDVGDLMVYQVGTGAPTLNYLENLERIGTPIVSGNLTVGTTYIISEYTSVNFVADGAGSNANYVVFEATDNSVTLTANDHVVALPTWESINFLDTDLFTDVSSLTSPDEYSYINCDDSIAEAIIENVRSQLAGDDVAMEGHRHRKFRKKASTGMTIRGGRKRKINVPPRVYRLDRSD
jgi:hypothetical protein